MTPRKYFVLLAVAFSGSVGDTLLSRGMKGIGEVHFGQLYQVIFAVANPWVLCGITFLLCFFASFSVALSWADLSFVLPATGFGYVVIALLAHCFLHEHISIFRWVGVALISVGVAFVTAGPSRTTHQEARVTGDGALPSSSIAVASRSEEDV